MGSLAIRRDGGIGDILMLTPALRALRRVGAYDEIAVYTSAGGRDMLWGNPHVDELGDWRRDWIDARQCYTRCVDLVGVVERHPQVGTRSRVDLFAELLGAPVGKDTKLDYYMLVRELDSMCEKLAPLPRPCVFLAPLAKDPRRSWDAEQIQRFARQALRHWGSLIVAHQTDAIADWECWDHVRCRPMWGQPLRDVAMAMKLADCVVSVDTGMYHLAAAVKPTGAMVLPFGATDALVQAQPYHMNRVYPLVGAAECHHFPCAHGAITECHAPDAGLPLFVCQKSISADAVVESTACALQWALTTK